MKKRERGAVIVTGLLVLGGFVVGSLFGLKLGSGNGSGKGTGKEQSQAVEKSKTPAAVKKKTYTLKDKAIYDEKWNCQLLDVPTYKQRQNGRIQQ